jgi:hypothetical protein
MKPKPTILSLALLLLMATPLLLSVVMQLRQLQVQHQAKERLEKEKQHTIALHKNQWHWVKKGKEIRVGNRLFDVHSLREVNGVFYFTGLYDDEETAIVKQLNHLQHNKQQSVAQTFFFFLGQLPETGTTIIHYSAASPDHHAAYTNHYHSFLLPVHAPPPKA